MKHDIELAPVAASLQSVELLQKPQQLTIEQKAAAFDVMSAHELRCMTIHGMLTVTNRHGIVVTVPAKAQPTPAAVFHQALMLAAEELAEREQANDKQPEECSQCAGTGEGYVDGSRCACCGGSGVKRPAKDGDDDFPEPETRKWTDY